MSSWVRAVSKRSFYIIAFLVIAMLGAFVLAACSDKESTTTPTIVVPASNGSETEAFEVVPLEKPLKAPSEVPEELEIIWEAWALLTRDHVDRSEFDPDEFADSAIRGLLATLNDAHTHYVRPDAFGIESADLQGSFEGIGANVSRRADGKLIIVAPIAGGPAEAAGIRSGDIILEVDGDDLEGLSLLGAVAKIRGPRGSSVKLLVQHLGELDPVEVVVTRDTIPLESVLLRSEPGARIAHIRLTSFYADSAQLLSDTISQVIDDGAEGLILDVRDNPGGLLGSVVDIVNLFLDVDDYESGDDPLVLYEVDGQGNRTNWKVRSGGVGSDIPMVVLTNGGSASASEILVGALQDHGRATIVGATTFGKGTVNILRELSNGGGLVITIARWFTPLGRPIQDLGLDPDVEVDSSDRRTAETLQLEKAMEILESAIGSKGSETTRS